MATAYGTEMVVVREQSESSNSTVGLASKVVYYVSNQKVFCMAAAEREGKFLVGWTLSQILPPQSRFDAPSQPLLSIVIDTHTHTRYCPSL